VLEEAEGRDLLFRLGVRREPHRSRTWNSQFYSQRRLYIRQNQERIYPGESMMRQNETTKTYRGPGLAHATSPTMETKAASRRKVSGLRDLCVLRVLCGEARVFYSLHKLTVEKPQPIENKRRDHFLLVTKMHFSGVWCGHSGGPICEPRTGLRSLHPLRALRLCGKILRSQGLPLTLTLALALSANAGKGSSNSSVASSQPHVAQQKDSKNQKPASAPDPEAELQRTLEVAGNDRAALVRQLIDYLDRFPDAPRKAAVYRALVEACQQLQNTSCALDYAERLIAVRPDDAQMMLLAVGILQKQGDNASLTKAAGYVTRVLDRVEKATPDEKPARSSQAEWQHEEEGLRVALYSLRGKIETQQQTYDAARNDLEMSYRLRANALAAEQLGEIAEIQKDLSQAIKHYLEAFVLPENGPGGTVDRREVRQKLGNVWRQVHASDLGLGDAILAAYDSANTAPTETRPAAKNKGAKELFAFTVRRLDGLPLPLAQFKGKNLVLSFWATWCGPCRELEPQFVKVAQSYSANSDVEFFAVDTDEDESRVPPFLAREKWSVPVIFADGLDDFLRVNTLPTVIVIDHAGKIVYRASGFTEEGFPEALTAAIQEALQPAK
jgi:thiol-disulfide isomerase/thioredoxin